ncbi:MAG: hypothetical protein P8L91_00445, partial [Candidatus Marinimicrobia bacterium]|nr:hypothetical protein [Candidatus Neomarinimicrobiota bacterium]
LASATLAFMKLRIISIVSGNIFTIIQKEGTNLNLTILYYWVSIRYYALGNGASSYSSWECKKKFKDNGRITKKGYK